MKETNLEKSVLALIELKTSSDIQLSSPVSNLLHNFCIDPALAMRLIGIVNGLGGSRHQQILRELIDETLLNCSDALFSLCAWWHEDIVPPFLHNLFIPLKSLPPTIPFQKQHLSVWNALLILISSHSLSCRPCAKQLLISFRDELHSGDWNDSCNKNFLLNILDSFVIDANEVLEKAINGMAFQFIRKCVIPLLQAQENTVAFEMVDSMLKQLIAHFPNKLILFLVLNFRSLRI
ncbi:unnamed protein product [Dracunculus medinensis]|uniref:SOSS complex subunit A homolog n=1 Tax=Dracunculus medinensis TaxID=318479 RepID=A0A0N4UDS0_DRAME|nr:unnamed protein product [Dracunculus medinensis]